MRDSAGFAIAHAQVRIAGTVYLRCSYFLYMGFICTGKKARMVETKSFFAFALKAIVDILKVEVKDFIEANKCSFIGWEKHQFYTSFFCILLLNVRLTFKRPTLIIQRES